MSLIIFLIIHIIDIIIGRAAKRNVLLQISVNHKVANQLYPKRAAASCLYVQAEASNYYYSIFFYYNNNHSN